MENSYAPYIQESWPDVEKLANGGKTLAHWWIEIETPHPEEMGLKRGSEEIIDF